MIKNTLTALITAAALAGVAVPAMAETPSFSNGDFDSDYVLTALKDKGISATAVEQWGSSYLVAWVNGAEGSASMIYLDPDTLEVVNF